MEMVKKDLSNVQPGFDLVEGAVSRWIGKDFERDLGRNVVEVAKRAGKMYRPYRRIERRKEGRRISVIP